MNPNYPVYVISKGRAESRLTSRALEAIRVPYRIVVEPQEYATYAAVIDPAKILVLPFSNLGQGSIPARNWVWEHALASGAARHWILDDNIEGFYRYNRNLKTPVGSGTIFRCAEDFVDRYENVALAGMQYFMFVSRKALTPPFTMNTRIYSCILIRNDLNYRWRGRYNEDTDLSLRILKDGWCTVLFNAFLCGKTTTMTMAGGNTDELYAADDGRLKMAESLVEQHPDVASVTWKWNRWQHSVNYGPFRGNLLRRKPGVTFPEGVNNYGMRLRVLSDAERAEIAAREAAREAGERSERQNPQNGSRPEPEPDVTGGEAQNGSQPHNVSQDGATTLDTAGRPQSVDDPNDPYLQGLPVSFNRYGNPEPAPEAPRTILAPPLDDEPPPFGLADGDEDEAYQPTLFE